jgi:hypothetical protein
LKRFMKPTRKETRPTDRYQCSSEVRTQLLDGAAVLVNGEDYFAINRIGARIWQMLGERLPMAEITSALMREFEIDLDRCQREVSVFIFELLDRKLILRLSDEE